MVRLPDIPDSLWKVDQLSEFERRTQSAFPALEFDLATRDWESEQLTPLVGIEEEEARRQELYQQQMQAEEEANARRRAEADEIYQTYLEKLNAAQDQDDTLVSQASNAGIPSPDEFTQDIYKFSHRPGVTDPDNTASAVYGEATDVPTTPGRATDSIYDETSFEAQLANAFGNAVNTVKQGFSNLASGMETEAQPARERWRDPLGTMAQGIEAEAAPVQESSLAQTGRQLAEDINSVYTAEQEAISARERAGVTPEQFEEEFRIGRPVNRELTPEEQVSTAATRKAVGTVLGAPLDVVEDTVDIALGDPRQEIRHKDPWGVLDALGVQEGVTKGEIIANVLPVRWLNLPQWLDVGRQFVETPAETAVGIGILASLGKLLTKGEQGQKIALAIIGGIAAGIHSAIAEKGLGESGAEVGLGTAVGYSTPAAIKGAGRLILDVARSPQTSDILRYLDRLAGKVYETASENLKPYPAIAEGLDLTRPGYAGLEQGNLQEVERRFSILDRIEKLQDVSYDKFQQLKQYLADKGDDAARVRSSADIPRVLEEERQDLTRSLLNDTPEGWGTIEGGARVYTPQEIRESVGRGLVYRTQRNLPEIAYPSTLIGSAAGTGAGVAAGLETVPEDAPFEQKLQAAVVGGLAGFSAGAPTGLAAGTLGAYGLAKLFQKAIVSGRMGDDIFSSHPDVSYRIASAMLLAARGKADDEVVAIPARVSSFIQRSINAGVPPEGLTAGQIRERYGNYNLMKLGRVTRDLLTDLLMGDESGGSRLHEMGADEAAILGLRRPRPDLNPTPNIFQQASSLDMSMVRGRLHSQITPDQHPDLYQRLQAIRNATGLPPARFFIANDTSVNASAFTGTGRAPVIVINKGAFDKLDDDALGAILMHEYSHATDDDISRGLLQRSAQFIRRLSGNQYPDTSARPVVPTEVVDQMTGIPVRQIDDPAILRSIEQRGGTYDPETGVTVGVTRSQGRRAAGGVASRGGPFYEPVREGQRSTYYNPNEQYDSTIVGGTLGGADELPRTMTRYRNPLIIGIGGYTDALAQLGVESQVPRRSSTRYEFYDPETGHTKSFASTQAMVDIISQQHPKWAVRDTGAVTATREEIANAVNDIKMSTRLGTSERTEALKSLLTKYGGNPNNIDDMQMVAGDTEESTWAITENIISTNARRQGHDATFIMTRDHLDKEALANDSEYQELLAKLQESLRRSREEPDRDTRLAMQDEQGRMNTRLHEIEQKYYTPEWSEIQSIREDRNPVPAPDHPLFDDWGNRREVPKVGRPGYSVHPDIELPEGVVRRTFGEPTITTPTLTDKQQAYIEAYDMFRAAQDEWQEVLYESPGDTINYSDPTVSAIRDAMDDARRNVERIGKTLDPEEMNAVVGGQRPGPQIVPPEWREFPGSSLAAGIPAGLAGTELEKDENEDIDWGKFLTTGVAGGILWKNRKNKLVLDSTKSNLTRQMLDNLGSKPRQTHPGLIEKAWMGWVERATDQLGMLQRTQDDIAKIFKEQTGELLPARFLAAELKRFDPNKSAQVFMDRTLKPAILAFDKLGIDPKDVDAYLMDTMYRDVGRYLGNYANTGRINYKRPFPGGKNAVEAENDIIRMEEELRRKLGPEGFKQFSDALEQVWNAGDEILQMKRDSGLIDEDTYAKLREAYPHYIPTSIIDYVSQPGNVGLGKSLSVSSNTIHKLTNRGTEKSSMGALAALTSSVYEAHAAAHKNRVFNAFVGLWQEASRLAPKIEGGRNILGNRTSAQRVQDFERLVIPWKKSKSVRGAGGENPEWVPLEGFIDGQKQKFAVHKDLGAITRFDSPVYIPILSGAMAIFRATATSRNPVFLMSNAALDAANYAIRETSRNNFNVGRVASAYGASMWGTLMNPAVWSELGRNEFSGDVARFLEGTSTTMGGGGYSGLAGRSNYIPQTLFDTGSKTPLERWIAERTQGMGWTPESASQAEVARLRRDVGYGTGAGTVGGAIAGGYAGAQAIDEEDTRGEKFGKIAAGALTGSVAGTAAIGRLEARNPRDMWRIFSDIWTMKPVERIGERIELIPRVASMKLAEGRYADVIGRAASDVRHATDKLERSRAQGRLEDLMQRRDIEKIQSGRTVTIDFNKGGTWARAINQIIPFFNVGMQAASDMPRMIKERPWQASTILGALAFPTVVAEAFNNRDAQTRADYDDVPDYDKNQGLVLMLPNEGQGVQVPVDDRGNRHPQYIHIRYRQFAPIAILSRLLLQQTAYRDPESDGAKEFADATLAGFQSQSPVQARDTADLAANLAPPFLGTLWQASINKDTFRSRNIVSEAADENASPLSQAMAENLGFNEYTQHPSFWEWATRDVLTGQAGLWHGASQIIAGDESKRYSPRQDAPVTGGLTGRVVKGSIGQLADEARENLLTPSALQILKDSGMSWRPAPSDPELYKVPLTRREYAAFQKDMNAAVDIAIHEASADPAWKDYNEAEKEWFLNKYLNYYRERVRGVHIDKIPSEEFDKRYKKQLEEGKIVPTRRR